MRVPLSERLCKELLVADGAMGTYLYQQGISGCFEEMTKTNPTAVKAVHTAYVEAGADIIQTNTYAANRIKLARYGLESEVVALNKASYELAASVAKGAYVVGTIGGIAAVQQGDLTLKERNEALSEQADALLETDVDGFLLETFYDYEELQAIVSYLVARTKRPVIAQVTLGDVGVLHNGTKLQEAFHTLEGLGAAVIGLNCRMGPYHMLQSLEEVELPATATLSAYPNASLPDVRDGRFSYQSNPTYFGDMAGELVKEGVTLLGGCCGTTPEHIHAFKQAIVDLAPITAKQVRRKSQADTAFFVKPPESKLTAPTNKPSIIIELDPPKALSNVPEFIEGAKQLTEAGADAITLADNSLASSRVDNLALGRLISEQVQARPLLHLSCRDRNIIGLQSHLLGLYTLGIHDVLAITGDPAKVGDFPGATSVYDMSSMELIRLMKQLNEGISFSGKDLGVKTSFTIGAAFNANARKLDREVLRLEKKIEAGADYFMSQPVYSVERLQEIHEQTKHLPVPVYIGIMPLVSSRNAEFLHHEVPGITLTDEARNRMAAVQHDKEASEREGIAMARELCDAAQELFSSIYLITPFLRYNMTATLTKHIRQQALLKKG